jgi:hypothetical protein
MDKKKIQKIVKEAYGKIAQGREGCGCGPGEPDAKEFAKSVGYSEKELKVIRMKQIWLSVVEIQPLWLILEKVR